MTRSTRNFMVGSAAILVAGLCTGLVAYYGGLPGTFASAAGPDELAYMPPDAAVVAHADVNDVMRSHFRQQLRDAMPDADRDKGRQELQEATGIDIEKDIQSVTACLVARGDNKEPLVAVRGSFDLNRIEAFAREKGATVDMYEGARIIQMQERPGHMESPDAGDEADRPEPRHRHRPDFKPVMAFAENDLVLFGSAEAVRRALDLKRSGQNLMTNAELMGKIGNLQGSSNAWAVGRFDALARHAKLPDEMSAHIPAMTWFEASGHVNGGMRGTLRVEASTEESAKNLRDMVNGFMAFGRLQGESKPEVQALMQAVTLGGDGKVVELGFTIPSELIDTMIAKAKADKARVKTVAME